MRLQDAADALVAHGMPTHGPRTPQTSTLASVDSDGFRVGRCRASCRSQSIAATRDSWLCAQRSHTEDIEATCEQEDIREEKESCAGCNESQEETTTVSHCTRDILVDLQTFWQQAYTTWDGMFRPRVCHGGFEHDDFPDGVGIYL